MTKRFNVGNSTITGFVNVVAVNDAGAITRITVGTGKYTEKATGKTVFKESVSVFFDKDFKGTIPAFEKGQYVQVGPLDLAVTEHRTNAGELNFTMNARFDNQLKILPTPTKGDKPQEAGAPASAPYDDDGLDV